MDVHDVGPLPTLPPPDPGDRIHLRLVGRSPAKTIGRSIRNPASLYRERFMGLRNAAIKAMAGRKWYEGPVQLELLYLSPQNGSVSGQPYYLSGVMDTIGGSHGPSFIYLPVVYLDDGQVVKSGIRREIASMESYVLTIDFLADSLRFYPNPTRQTESRGCSVQPDRCQWVCRGRAPSRASAVCARVEDATKERPRRRTFTAKESSAPLDGPPALTS
jgi:hypothetical protein